MMSVLLKKHYTNVQLMKLCLLYNAFKSVRQMEKRTFDKLAKREKETLETMNPFVYPRRNDVRHSSSVYFESNLRRKKTCFRQLDLAQSLQFALTSNLSWYSHRLHWG